jgi:hypothetical protein
MADEQANWFENLGSTDWWTKKQPEYLGPDTQYALSGMAKAVNPNGISGRVGEMFQQYIQGMAAREAFKKRMESNEAFQKSIFKLLGGQQVELPEQLSSLLGDTSSKDWLAGLTDPYGTLRQMQSVPQRQLG